MSDTRWRGTWWLPGWSGHEKPGTLYYGDDGRLALELIGGFVVLKSGPADSGELWTGESEMQFPVVHGMCGAERFTLFDAVATHISGPFLGPSTSQTLQPLRALRGIHVSGPRDEVFDSAQVQLEYLFGWARRSCTFISKTLDRGSASASFILLTVCLPGPISYSFAFNADASSG